MKDFVDLSNSSTATNKAIQAPGGIEVMLLV
jgi:hypothetical protein